GVRENRPRARLRRGVSTGRPDARDAEGCLVLELGVEMHRSGFPGPGSCHSVVPVDHTGVIRQQSVGNQTQWGCVNRIFGEPRPGPEPDPPHPDFPGPPTAAAAVIYTRQAWTAGGPATMLPLTSQASGSPTQSVTTPPA